MFGISGILKSLLVCLNGKRSVSNDLINSFLFVHQNLGSALPSERKSRNSSSLRLHIVYDFWYLFHSCKTSILILRGQAHIHLIPFKGPKFSVQFLCFASYCSGRSCYEHAQAMLVKDFNLEISRSRAGDQQTSVQHNFSF